MNKTYDQATHLRSLVNQSATWEPQADRPRIITLCAGKGGQGSTTVSVNLALALAERGRRVVLVDASLSRPDVANLLRIDPAFSILDVLSGQRNVHEALTPGPGGIMVLPGAWDAARGNQMVTPLELSRLRHEFERLGRHADVLVLDAGNTNTPALAEFWRMADLVLTMTTTQPLALMGTYALIKSLHTEALHSTLVTLVNQSSDEDLAERITDRIQEATQRFSGRAIEAWPGIPFDPAVSQWDEARRPWWLTARLDPAALALEQLGERCLAVLAEVGTHGRTLACA